MRKRTGFFEALSKWKCYRCGTVYDQESPPDTCTNCNASVSFWIDWTEARTPLDDPVSRYMERRLVTIDINKTAWDAARIMRDKNVGSVFVCQDGKPVGIVTEWDMLIKVVADDLPAAHVLLRKIMSSPLTTVNEDTSTRRAMSIMDEKGFRRLLVTRNGEAVGMITQSGLVREALREAPALV